MTRLRALIFVASFALFAAPNPAFASETCRDESASGQIRIVTNVDDLAVRIDGRCAVDASTREELCVSRERERVVLVSPGRRQIMLMHADYAFEQRNVDVVAGQEIVLRINGPAILLVEEKNPFVASMWISWGLGAATLGGAIAAGVVVAGRPDGDAAPLERAEIALAAGSAIAIAAATYFTVRSLRWKPSPTSEVAWSGFGLRGSF